jgi:hypothetical protein
MSSGGLSQEFVEKLMDLVCLNATLEVIEDLIEELKCDAF